MKSTSSTHIHKILLGFSLSFLGILFLSCQPKPPIMRRSVKVVLAGPPSYLCNELGKLTDDGRSMFDELESDNDKYKYTYILDPTLLRLDLKTEYSIITKVERSGITAQGNPKMVVKLVKQNLENLTIPESFLIASKSINVDSLYSIFMSSLTSKDSIVVFFEKAGSDSVTIDNKLYKTLTTVAEVRSRFLSIICQDAKANIVLLINPPLVEPNTVIPEKPKDPVAIVRKPHRIVVDHLPVQKVTREKFTGVLTIIKGSEGCEGCTRYYSGKDDLGITHEVRENNSINCCPCGKTVQINGRSYRMECSDEGNKLTLVD